MLMCLRENPNPDGASSHAEDGNGETENSRMGERGRKKKGRGVPQRPPSSQQKKRGGAEGGEML